MKWFYNMKISKKLISAFIIVAVLSGAFIGAVGIVNIININNRGNQIFTENLVPLNPIHTANVDFLSIRMAIKDMALSKDADKSKYVNTINDQAKNFNAHLDEYSKVISSNEEAANFKTLTDDIDKYYAMKDKVVNYLLSNQLDNALVIMNGDGADISKSIQACITKAFDININQAKERNASNITAGKMAEIMMVIIVIISIFISFIIGLFISKIISKPLNIMVEVANKISEGNLDVNLEVDTKDETGMLAQSFKKIIEALKRLTADSNMLVDAAVEGRLGTRAEINKHSGDYRKIVEGVNRTLDAVIGPLLVAADYVDNISKGNIPPRITDSYNGDFNEIKNNLNSCIDNISALVADANMLEKAALEGKLSTRADASKHGGDYRKIVEGVNKTLDAVIEPLQESAAVLKEMADGNLRLKVKGNYKGDHAEIKNALNETIDTLSLYVNEISQVLNEMANSNLNLGINNDYKGNFAPIKDALNLIIESFNEVFGEINSSADQVATGSKQVSFGSQALSQGATEQASSIEELTASITQIAAQTKENAVNANQANELALNAKNNAEQGNFQMKQMLKSMEEINESSSNISKIIKVIDEIAFQTNILALNAAVEAARAGQHGKGFAVVAEEVRNLAARSANAAKETTDLIEGSIKKVEAGTKIASGTAAALDEIVTGVAKAANLVGNIASASNEQATAISQINKGVEQVSTVVQTNSATAEESAAASEELSSQADILKNMVGKFKLKKTGSSFSGYQISSGHKDKPGISRNSSSAYSEAAVTGNKTRISLSDREFGKY